MPRTTIPTLIIHGGAGKLEGNVALGEPHLVQEAHGKTPLADFDAALREIAAEAHQVLLEGDAREGVLHAIRLLEDHPLFNAGTGSRLQSDGKVRMSAALMDGPGNRLAGVINVEDIRHPIDLAAMLSTEKNTLLAGELASAFARSKGFAQHNPITPQRWEEYQQTAQNTAPIPRGILHTHKMGTVGAVALDATGRIWAGTSTGGVGGEIPGRVSDAPTVAGTYATEQVGISCTGKGEQITHQATAARLAVRVDDGMPLAEAVSKTIGEADARDYQFGLIALDARGNTRVGQTAGVTTMFATHNGKTLQSFFDPAKF